MATKRKTHDDSHAWLGKKIPALKVTLQNGETSALKSILNEDGWNVLYFYPRDNTPGCTQEAKDFQKSLRKFSNRAITIVGVSPDSPTSHVKFIKKLGLKFSLIADEDKALCEKMGTWQKKKFMGREFMGVVRSTFLCKGHKVVRVWQPVKVKDHVLNVLDSVEELS